MNYKMCLHGHVEGHTDMRTILNYVKLFAVFTNNKKHPSCSRRSAELTSNNETTARCNMLEKKPTNCTFNMYTILYHLKSAEKHVRSPQHSRLMQNSQSTTSKRLYKKTNHQ